LFGFISQKLDLSSSAGFQQTPGGDRLGCTGKSGLAPQRRPEGK
jgi:hypothetical protein